MVLKKHCKLLKTGINNINLYHWVIEENNFQKAIRQDPRIKEYANKNGIILEGHETYKNKWDSHFGVTSLAPMFQDKLIILPYGNAESQVKVRNV